MEQSPTHSSHAPPSTNGGEIPLRPPLTPVRTLRPCVSVGANQAGFGPQKPEPSGTVRGHTVSVLLYLCLCLMCVCVGECVNQNVLYVVANSSVCTVYEVYTCFNGR